MGGSERRLQSWRGGRAEKAKCEKSGTWMKSKSEIIPCSSLHHLNDRISLSVCWMCLAEWPPSACGEIRAIRGPEWHYSCLTVEELER